MSEGELEKWEQLAGIERLDQLLEVAIQFERAAAAFYRQQLDRVSKPLRWLLQSLVEEEQQHEEKLQALRDDATLERALQQRIEQPVIDPRFSDALQPPLVDEMVDDQAILQYALGREQLAQEQYRKLAEITEAGAVQELFQWLADEELQHKGYLERRYYELVHRVEGI